MDARARLDLPADPTREQVQKLRFVARKCGYTHDEIDDMLCSCWTADECDELLSLLARELVDVIRGIR